VAAFFFVDFFSEPEGALPSKDSKFFFTSARFKGAHVYANCLLGTVAILAQGKPSG
jgi:hypothetical protein